MAQVGFSQLACPASQAVGAAADMTGFYTATVSVEGTFTATYQVQISLDASATPASASWQNEGTALSAAGTVLIQKPCAWVRLNCTAYASGTPTARLAGVAQVAR